MTSRPLIHDPLTLALCGLAAVVLLQLVPLPAGLVAALSPARMRLAREVAEAAGEAPAAWLPLTVCVQSTRDGLLLLVAYVSVFYAASVLFAVNGRWKLLFGAAAASGCVLSVLGFGQVLPEWGTRLSSTFVNPNRFAALMAMSGACAVGMFVSARGRRDRGRSTGEFRFPRGTIWLVVAVVVETALLLTLSRLGIASMFVAALLTVALLTGRRSVWGALAGILLVLAANAALAADPVLARYSVLFDQEFGGGGRHVAWRMALPMVSDFPAFGSGAGTFRHAFHVYQDPSLPGWWTNAHNDYLNLLTDTGLAGLSAAVVALVFGLRGVIRLRRSDDPSTRAIAVAGMLGGSAVLLHSVADFPLQEPAVALLFFALAGTAHGRGSRTAQKAAAGGEAGSERRESDRREFDRREKEVCADGGRDETLGPARWIPAAYLTAAAALCAAALPSLAGLHSAGKLEAEASGIPVGRGEEVDRDGLLRRVGLLERAVAADPWAATAWYEVARTRVRLLAEDMQAGEAKAAIQSARRALERGRALSPLDPQAYYLGAVLTWRPDSTEHPDRMMLLALRLAPAWHDVSYQVGHYFLKRWYHARRREGAFGLLVWQQTLGRPDELFTRMARALTFAARSPRVRTTVVELVLDHRLSSREIDAALEPDVETDLALARSLARRGDHREACSRYKRVVASGGLELPLQRIRISYAKSLLGAGDTKGALEQFEAALRACPDEELGQTVRALGSAPPRADAAALADYWRTVRERMPSEPAVLLALGRAELAAGREEPGFAHLFEYAKETRAPEVFAELARFASARKEFALAATLAAEAARLDPDVVSYHMMLAGALLRIGRREAASASYMKALLLEPRNLAAARGFAKIEVGAGRYPSAIRVWTRFLDAGGAPVPAHEALADIYLGLADPERACDEIEKALEASPGDRRLREKREGVRVRLAPPLSRPAP